MFETRFVRHPKDRFCCVETHVIKKIHYTMTLKNYSDNIFLDKMSNLTGFKLGPNNRAPGN